MAFTKHSLATLALLLAVATPLAATAKPLASSGCLCCMAEIEACIKCRRDCEARPGIGRTCGLVCRDGSTLDSKNCRCVPDDNRPRRPLR